MTAALPDAIFSGERHPHKGLGLLARGKENEMPYINVKLIEGVFTPQQKREIAGRLTEAMVEIEGEHMRELTTVVIDETKSGDWSIGGRCLSTEDVRALAAGSATGATG